MSLSIAANKNKSVKAHGNILHLTNADGIARRWKQVQSKYLQSIHLIRDHFHQIFLNKNSGALQSTTYIFVMRDYISY